MRVSNRKDRSLDLERLPIPGQTREREREGGNSVVLLRPRLFMDPSLFLLETTFHKHYNTITL